jgi:putative CocE/NonD family hydrolase
MRLDADWSKESSMCIDLTLPLRSWQLHLALWQLLVVASGFAQVIDTSAPKAEPKPFQFSADVMVAMRDSVKLATNVFRPSAEGAYPVILMRSPYGKPGADWGEAARYTRAGYVMVVQDCRGRGASEGTWDPFRYDVQDGLDTQQWIVQQPWASGDIGTAGGSYVGWTQWASAADNSSRVKAMVPIVPFADIYPQAYPGGAFQLALLFGWGSAVGGLNLTPNQLTEAYRHLPLQNWDSQFGRDVFFLGQWIEHPTYDDYWRQRGIQFRFDQVTVPILNIGGWYDIFSKTTIDMVDRVRAESKNRLARRNQYVVMGPWGHGVGGSRTGQLDFGSSATMDVGELQFKWFEYWLRGQETGVEDWPAYLLFVMGENRWRGENEWPLKRTRFTPFYLSSAGQANTRQGNGHLTDQPPGDQPADSFVYDPNDPVPTVGGNNLVGAPVGPYDQSELEQRQDVLVYTSEPMKEPLEVTGPVKMVLYASTTATDTDFTAKLVDVHPDGRAMNLCDGIVRARYRQPDKPPELVKPSDVYRFEIDLWVTSNVFLPGHRVRVEVSSSNFPRFDRNPNSGKPFGTDTDLLAATQTIYHDARRSSHIVLPVIPREDPVP